MWPRWRPLGLTPSDLTITAFGGHIIQHCGTCELRLSHGGHSEPYSFHIVTTTGPTMLGLPTCRNMKPVAPKYSLTTATQDPLGNTDAKKELPCQYKDCFEGTSCFKGEFHITLDPAVPPVLHPPPPPPHGEYLKTA